MNISDHGGIFGGGKRQPISTKIIKQQYRLPFAMASNGASTRYVCETKTYLWYSYANSQTQLFRINKRNPSDIKAVNLSSIGNSVIQIIPLYDDNKIIVLSNSRDFYSVDEALTVTVTATMFTYVNSECLAYYYNKVTKILYLAVISGSDRILVAVNLSNLAVPTQIYTFIILTIGDSSVYTYAGFEPENDAMRLIHTGSGGYANKRLRLSDGNLIANYPTLANGWSYQMCFGESYNTAFYINGTYGISKMDLTTGALITSKAGAALRTEIQPFFTKTFGSMGEPRSFIKKLPNGQFLGLMQADYSNVMSGSYPPYGELIFTFDSNLVVTGAEWGFSMATALNSNGARDLNNKDKFMFEQVNNESHIFFL